MKYKIDKENWNRVEHFNFFKTFEDPNHGIVVNVDCTAAYQYAKQQGESFYLYYLHKILKAINAIEEFKYRIEGDDVFCYETIHGDGTVGREDHTFGFAFYEYNADRAVFTAKAEKENLRVKASSGLLTEGVGPRLDTIHFSAVPWFSFTSLKHARSLNNRNGIPKISTGKLFASQDRLLMPMQIEVHHGLIDGWHIGQLIDKIEELLKEDLL